MDIDERRRRFQERINKEKESQEQQSDAQQHNVNTYKRVQIDSLREDRRVLENTALVFWPFSRFYRVLNQYGSNLVPLLTFRVFLVIYVVLGGLVVLIESAMGGLEFMSTCVCGVFFMLYFLVIVLALGNRGRAIEKIDEQIRELQRSMEA